ncbi:MAG: hypothetical protein ACJ790_11880, partial [Myxococcaceae bacterium]
MPRFALGFWIDPLESLQVGHDVFYFESRDVEVHDGGCQVRARRVWLNADKNNPSQLLDERIVPISSFDAVFLRKDPPADVHYQHVTRMLDMTGGDRRPLYVNEPSAIRTANEKLFALQFAELCPRTLVTSDPKSFRRFREEHGDVVVKPLDGFGGRGVFFVRRD